MSSPQIKRKARPSIKYSKYCIVPKCYNTNVSTPNKLFFAVPRVAKIRKKWCNVMRRNDKTPLSSKSVLYCCEDHFDVETDMENYLRHQMMGGPLKLRKGVTPHKFDCQKDTKKQPTERTAFKKRQQIEFLKRVLNPDICHENLITHVEFVECKMADSDIDPIGNDMPVTLGYKSYKSVGVQVNIKTKKYRSKATNTPLL